MTTKNSGMHPIEKQEMEILDFASYIRKFIPEYKFDADNEKIIANLGLWAARNEKFNNREQGWHIDRGILICGVPGVGKDEIFRNLRKYISYLRSPYGYGHRIVWQYAKEFQKDKVGYSCFDSDKGNLYYEELALTDEKTGEISREYVQHFGNKLLIGREIINIRYNLFKEKGWMTHFSTNCKEEQLLAVYGERCVDRLAEMCNFMAMPGRSKRGLLPPVFIHNNNQPAPPKPRETTVDEHLENKKLLETEYRQFCDFGVVPENAYMSYMLLKSYGCSVATDDDMRLYMEMAAGTFKEVPDLKKISISQREQNKQSHTWNTARKMAVEKFYATLKLAGAKTIFQVVDVAAAVNKFVPNS